MTPDAADEKICFSIALKAGFREFHSDRKRKEWNGKRKDERRRLECLHCLSLQIKNQEGK